jgi:hypothetical protein
MWSSAAFRVTVSSTMELVLRHSPNNTALMEVVDGLVAKFQKVEGCWAKLEQPAVRICDLLLGPPPGRA